MSSRRNELRNTRTSALNIPMSDADAAGFGGEKIPLPDVPMPRPSLAVQLQQENNTLKGELENLRQQLESRTSAMMIQDGTMYVHDFQFTPKGLIAPQKMDRDSWQQVGDLLFKLEGSLQWLIGDWLVYGIDLKYGDIPKFAEMMGKEEKTLRNYMVVSRAVELSRRRDNLTFGHHEVVTKLEAEEQNDALDYAAQNNLSVAAFRKLIRGDSTSEMPALTEKVSQSKFGKLHNSYLTDVNRHLYDQGAADTLSDRERGEVARQAEWLAEIYLNVAKRLKGHS